MALDPASGRLRWSVADRDTSCQMRPHPPAFDGGTLYLASGDGQLVAVDGDGSRVLWRTPVGCASVPPIFWRSHIYVGLDDLRLVRVRATDGVVVGDRAVLDRPTGRLTTAGEVLVVIAGEGTIVALSESLERTVWERPVLDGTWSAFQPILWRERLVVGDSSGNVLALDPETGTVDCAVQLEGTIRGLGAAGEFLFAGTFQGTVYALRARPGGLMCW